MRTFPTLILFILLTTLAGNLQAQWVQSNTGLANLYDGAMYAEGDTLYVGAINGIYKSTNQGTNWSLSNTGLSNFPNPFSILRSGNFLIAGGDGAGIWRSSDYGAHWSQTTSGVASNEYVLNYFHDGGNLYAASGYSPAISISTDDGATWAKHTTGLPGGDAMSGIAVSGSVLLATHRTLGVFASTDNGGTWASSNSGLTVLKCNAIFTSASNTCAATDSGIFLSSNSGSSWARVLTSGKVLSIVKSGATLYAVGDAGYKSVDDGSTWTSFDFTGITGQAWTIQFTSSYVFVNTYANGIYRRPIGDLVTSVTTNDDVPNAFALNQNYPNPFNPTTVITYSLPASEFVSLKVYDMLGRIVLNLVNGYQSAGNKEVTFNAAHLPGGIYLYRLSAGNYNAVKKMSLIR